MVDIKSPRPVWKKCAGYADYSADDNDADQWHPERIGLAECWHGWGQRLGVLVFRTRKSDKEGLSCVAR
jgi:hypothetical protein